MSDLNAVGPEEARDPRFEVNVGRFWAGAGATALVAALIGVVGVVILDSVFDLGLAPIDFLRTDSVMSTYAIHGALAGLAAAGLLFVLIRTTPRPLSFFGWIMALAIAVTTALPFGYAELSTALATGALNLIMGIAIWSLLAGVARMTTTRAPLPAPGVPPQAPPPQAPPRRPPSY